MGDGFHWKRPILYLSHVNVCVYMIYHAPRVLMLAWKGKAVMKSAKIENDPRKNCRMKNKPLGLSKYSRKRGFNGQFSFQKARTISTNGVIA